MNQGHVPQLPASAVRRATAITPDDSNDLVNFSSRGLFIGVAGDLKVNMVECGTTIVFKAPKGFLDIAVKRIYATDTTATDIVALF